MPDDLKAACPPMLPGLPPGLQPPGCQPSVEATRAGVVGALIVHLQRSIDLLLLWKERARQRRALYGSSDHLLKDIGLSRADVESEVGKRPWHR
jgi:uncharacterized protein YjiS (DUF1127 family)